MPNLVEAIKNRTLTQHPGALLIERGERHVRHLIETLPDGRPRFATVSGPLLHYHDGSDWQEINTDWLDSAETGFVDTVQAAAFIVDSDANGRKRLKPRRKRPGEYVEFARPQTPAGVNIPWASRTRQGNTVLLDRDNASLALIHTAGGIKIDIVLKDPSAATAPDTFGMRWPVSLVGLHRVGWQLVSDTDGTVVATIRPPIITEDGNGPLETPRPVQCDVVGGAVEFTANLTGLAYPIVIDPTIDVGTAAGGDDSGERITNGNCYPTAAFDYSDGTTVNSGPRKFLGNRFPLSGPASGDTIDEATLSYYIWSALAVDVDIYAEDVDSAGAFGAGDFDISGRALTTASVIWTTTATGDAQNVSPDIKDVVQEVINRAGWASGNYLDVITVARSSSQFLRKTYEGSATNCSQLHVVYTAAGGTAIKQNVNDILQLAESAARALALRRFSASSLQVSESIKRAMALSRGTADTVNVAETTGKAATLRRLVAETVNVVEASRAARGLRRLVAETVTVGITELITNGGFETAGAGGDDVWANWVEDKQDGAIADEAVITHGGGHAAKLTQGASLATDIRTINYTVVADTAYTFQFWTGGDGTNAGRYGIYDNTHSAEIVTSTTTGIAGTTYALFTTTFTTPAGCTSIRFYLKPAAVDGAVAYFDDVSCINHAASWAALGLRRSVADIVNIAETTSSGIATSIVKAINEALQLAESSLRTLALSRPVAETVQVLETVIRPARWLRLVAETVTITEATKAARALRRFASDLVQIIEATGQTLTQPGVVTAIVKNIAETLQLIEARAVAKWPTGRLGIDIKRSYAIIRVIGRLYAAVVQGRQYRARHEK